jgi:phosphate transport system permease protein
VRWAAAAVFVTILVAFVATLLAESSQAFAHSGVRFLWGDTWDPTSGVFGAGPFIVDTMITTLVALGLAVPIGIASASFLSELAPQWLAAPLSVLIDLTAAVPSVVVGLWGLIVLTPVFRVDVEPFLQSIPGVKHFFEGTPEGASILLAGVVLAVMILPTIVALSRTALSGVAVADREAARALGATRWQVVRKTVIPGARSGIEAAVTLAMGRALGEAIAVSMVIGSAVSYPHSVGTTLLSPGTTLGSAIVNFFGEASSGLERSAVFALVVVLLGLSALVNAGGQLLLRRRSRATGNP